MVEQHTKYHADGTVWGKGQLLNDEMHGYWEWFRKDGTKMRSGHLNNGKQIGEWITYNQKGEVHKVTHFKDKNEESK